MENEVITEDVKGESTQWLYPLVIKSKGEHDIRICLDMCGTNKSITRVWYSTPAIDDLLVEIAHINGKENISDFSSNHSFANSQESRQYVNFICRDACSKTLTLNGIKQATKNEKRKKDLLSHKRK